MLLSNSMKFLFLGNAVRCCDDNGVWSWTDLLPCVSPEFVNLLEEVMIVITKT